MNILWAGLTSHGMMCTAVWLLSERMAVLCKARGM
jgi:hypothetical protein